MRLSSSVAVAGLLSSAFACESCEHPERDVVLTGNVRRMQPDAQNASSAPRAPLAWDSWLEGDIKEKNYGADWGDMVSFTRDMRRKAEAYDVDSLDLHDGAGLSDATSPNGVLSNPIFENINYDLLTIGNHELYISDITYEHYYNFSRHYGDKYLTSNVQVYNPASGAYEYLGNTHRYFTTPKGIRIMSFGVLYDFTGNSNASKVIPAAEMVNQTWFQNALRVNETVDMFLLIGHNPVRPSSSTNTLMTVYNAIRAVHPNTPIQIFGGHTHIRDFAVYDDKTTALESGRYCETLGWLSMSGLNSSTYTGCANLAGVPNPSMPAQVIGSNSTRSASAALTTSTTPSSLLYSRRYLDWNRLTFEYHAAGSQVNTFDTGKGLSVTENITETRQELNLTALYGCTPQTWCFSCAPFLSNGSIYTVFTEALSATIINETRAEIPRIILNTGSVRFDLIKGPFTYADSFIVSPFTDAFQYIPSVPYDLASQVLPTLNAGAFEKRSVLSRRDFDFYNPSLPEGDDCFDPPTSSHGGLHKRSTGRIIRRQNYTTTPGYVTTDDFGTDGDDTVHSKISYYSTPNDFQANGSFPTNGSLLMMWI